MTAPRRDGARDLVRDFLVRGDRRIASPNRAVNELLTAVHRAVVGEARSRGIDTRVQTGQEFLRIALPAMAPAAGGDGASLGGRVVIEADGDAMARLEAAPDFQRVAAFWFRQAGEGDAALPAGLATTGFLASRREKATPAAARRRTRRLAARAAARGEAIDRETAAVCRARGPDPRPFVNPRSASTGRVRPRLVDTESRPSGALGPFDLWGFSIPAAPKPGAG